MQPTETYYTVCNIENKPNEKISFEQSERKAEPFCFKRNPSTMSGEKILIESEQYHDGGAIA